MTWIDHEQQRRSLTGCAMHDLSSPQELWDNNLRVVCNAASVDATGLHLAEAITDCTPSCPRDWQVMCVQFALELHLSYGSATLIWALVEQALM